MRVHLLLGLAAAAIAFPASAKEGLIERGDYLANRVAVCGDCHSPRGPHAASADLGGAPFPGARTNPELAPFAPNLRGLPAGYTRESLAALLQTGVRPDGSKPRRPMPGFRLTVEDARAVVAYLASLPAEGR